MVWSVERSNSQNKKNASIKSFIDYYSWQTPYFMFDTMVVILIVTEKYVEFITS